MCDPSTTLASLYMLLLLSGSEQARHTELVEALTALTQPCGMHTPAIQRGGAEEPAPVALKLQGTFSIAGRRRAVINSRRVDIGDHVSGGEVIEIKKHHVLLDVDGESVELVASAPRVMAPLGGGEISDNPADGKYTLPFECGCTR